MDPMDRRKLRPQLDSSLSILPSSFEEKFQNEILRPILKLQHALLVAVFNNYLKGKKMNFEELQEVSQLAMIEASLSRDLSVKNQLIGVVVGMFTVDEYQEYAKHRSELNKRIATMLKKRFADSLSEFSN